MIVAADPGGLRPVARSSHGAGLRPPGRPFPDRVAGLGRLDITRVGARSVATRAYAASPLRLLLPRNGGDAAWVFTSSFGGGLVDGDRVQLEMNVGPGAAALLSTQASTKVYRSPQGVSTTLHAHVGEGSLLVALPDPVVPYQDSRYVQEQRFDVAAGGALVLVDWLSSGRREAGERWAFASYRAALSVRLDGRRVLHDVLALRREDGPLAGRLDRYDVLALVVIVGAPLEPYAAALEAAAPRTIDRDPAILTGVTRLTQSGSGDAGVLLRVAGPSVDAVGRIIRASLSFIPALLGDDPWARKW